MAQIVLTPEQARLAADRKEFVELRDPAGNYLGYVAHGVTAEDIAIARQRMKSNAPRWTTAQVLEHLKSLPSP
jgi:hypothetical protein